MGQHPSKEETDEEGNSNCVVKGEAKITLADSNGQGQGRKQVAANPRKEISSMVHPSWPSLHLVRAIHRSGLLDPLSPITADNGHLISEPIFKIQQALYRLDTPDVANTKRNSSSLRSPFSVSRAVEENALPQPGPSSGRRLSPRKEERVRKFRLKRLSKKQIGIVRKSVKARHNSPRFQEGKSGSSTSSSLISAVDVQKIRKSQNLVKQMSKTPWWKQTRFGNTITKGRKLTENIIPFKPVRDQEGKAKPSTREAKSKRVTQTPSQKYFTSHRWAAHLPRIRATTNVGPHGPHRYQRRIHNKMFTEWIGPHRSRFFAGKTVAPPHQYFLHTPNFYYSDSSTRTMRPNTEQPKIWKTVEPTCMSDWLQDCSLDASVEPACVPLRKQVAEEMKVDSSTEHGRASSVQSKLHIESNENGEGKVKLYSSATSSNSVDERLPSFVCLNHHFEEHVKSARIQHSANIKNSVSAIMGGQEMWHDIELLNSDSNTEINAMTSCRGLRGQSSTNNLTPTSNRVYWTFQNNFKRLPKQKRMAAGQEVFGDVGTGNKRAGASEKPVKNEQIQGTTAEVSCAETHHQVPQDTNNIRNSTIARHNICGTSGVAKRAIPNTSWCNEGFNRQYMERIYPSTTETEINSATEECDSDETVDPGTDNSSTLFGSETVKKSELIGINVVNEHVDGSNGQESRYPQRTWLVPTLLTSVKMKTVSVPPLFPTGGFNHEKDGLLEFESLKCSAFETGQKTQANTTENHGMSQVQLWVENQRTVESNQGSKDEKLQTDAHGCTTSASSKDSYKEDSCHCFETLNSEICSTENRHLAGTEPIAMRTQSIYRSEKGNVGPLTTVMNVSPQLMTGSSSSQPFSTSSSAISETGSSLLAGQDECLKRQKENQKNPLAKTLEVLKSAFQAATRWTEQVTGGSCVQNYVYDSSSSRSSSLSSDEMTYDKSEASSTCEVIKSKRSVQNKCVCCTALPVTHSSCQCICAKAECYTPENGKRTEIYEGYSPTTVPLMFSKILISSPPQGHRGATLVCPHVARLEGRMKQSIASCSLKKDTDARPKSILVLSTQIEQHGQCATGENKAVNPPKLMIPPIGNLPDQRENEGETKVANTKSDALRLHVKECMSVEVCDETVCTPSPLVIGAACPQPCHPAHDLEVENVPCACHTDCTCWVSRAQITCGHHRIEESVSPESWRIRERLQRATFRFKRLEMHYNAGIRIKKNESRDMSTSLIQQHKRQDNSARIARRLMALDWLVQRHRHRYNVRRKTFHGTQPKIRGAMPFQKPLSAHGVMEHFFLPLPSTSHIYVRLKLAKPKVWVKKKRPAAIVKKKLCKLPFEKGSYRRIMCLHLPTVKFDSYRESLQKAKSRGYLKQCRAQPKVEVSQPVPKAKPESLFKPRKSEKSVTSKEEHLVASTDETLQAKPKVFKDVKQEKEAEFASATKPNLTESSHTLSKSETAEQRESDASDASDESDNLSTEQLRGLADARDETPSSYWAAVRQQVKKKETVIVSASSKQEDADRHECRICSSFNPTRFSTPDSICICRHQFCGPKPPSSQPVRKRRVVVVAKHPPQKKKSHNLRVTVANPLPPNRCEREWQKCQTDNGHHPIARVEALESHPQTSRESIEAGGERNIGVRVHHLTPRSNAIAWKESIEVEELLKPHSDLQPATRDAQQCRSVKKTQFGDCMIANTKNLSRSERVDHSNADYRTQKMEEPPLPFARDAYVKDENICRAIAPLSTKFKGTNSSQFELSRSCTVVKKVSSEVKNSKKIWNNEKTLPIELLCASAALRKRLSYCHQQEIGNEDGKYRANQINEDGKYRERQIPTQISLPVPTPSSTSTPTPTPTPSSSLPSLCAWSLSSIGPPQQTIPEKPPWLKYEFRVESEENSSVDETDRARVLP